MKQRILNEARKLYNKNGLTNVTARTICSSLEISLGSFSYHFPNKKIILESLYNEMNNEIQEMYDIIQHKEPSITTYLVTHKQLFLIQEKYKFFYLNLFEILTNNKNIKLTHSQNRAAEIKMAEQVFQYYMQFGILKKDISKDEINRLINVGQILNNFWSIDAEISNNIKNNKLIHYMKICCGLLEPYLESNSLKDYNSYFEELSKQG